MSNSGPPQVLGDQEIPQSGRSYWEAHAAPLTLLGFLQPRIQLGNVHFGITDFFRGHLLSICYHLFILLFLEYSFSFVFSIFSLEDSSISLRHRTEFHFLSYDKALEFHEGNGSSLEALDQTL